MILCNICGDEIPSDCEKVCTECYIEEHKGVQRLKNQIESQQERIVELTALCEKLEAENKSVFALGKISGLDMGVTLLMTLIERKRGLYGKSDVFAAEEDRGMK
jgi:hypothetical protein